MGRVERADKSVVYMGRVDESRQASAGCLRRPLPAVCGGLFRPFAAAFSGRLRRPLPAVCGGLLTRAWCTWAEWTRADKSPKMRVRWARRFRLRTFVHHALVKRPPQTAGKGRRKRPAKAAA